MEDIKPGKMLHCKKKKENVTLQESRTGMVRARGLDSESEEPALHFHRGV